MLPEISLNILDIAQNSIRAKASLIQIGVAQDTVAKTLTITIQDDGCGMTEQQVQQVIDPFYTTRTTRKIGLGVPFFRSAALITGGTFSITSAPGVGTTTTAVFHTDHIDCMPLGDLNSTILILITMNETMDFLYTYSNQNKSFSLDTRELRQILNDIPFSTPDVKQFIESYLYEHQLEVDT